MDWMFSARSEVSAKTITGLLVYWMVNICEYWHYVLCSRARLRDRLGRDSEVIGPSGASSDQN